MADQLIVTEQQGRLTFILQQDGGLPEPIAGNDSFENPLTPDDLEDLRWYLEDYLTAPFAVWEDRGETVQAKLKHFGNHFFNALFGHGETGRDAYLKIEDAPSWELWLSSENPAFLGLPWELLWDPKKPDPLALTLASINRTLPQRQPALDAASGETLRVLMVIARPEGLQDVSYRAVARPLFDKLEAVAGKVEIDLLRPPTFDALRQRLLAAKTEDRPYQILHFDGHGTFGIAANGDLDPNKFKGTAKGYLLFEGATEEARLIAADDFGTLIDEADIPLVVLNACRSGTLGTSVGPEATVATRLMQSGAAAVVAMGFSVYVRAAAEFMAAFYESLFQGENVAHAVTRGRRQLRRFHLRPSPKGDLSLQDWCVPVHYSRRRVAFPGLARLSDARQSTLSLENALDSLREKEKETAAEQAQDPLAPVGRFVGRDRAFFVLEQALGRMPVTLLHGVGGTGKTELGKAFARWLHQTGWAEGVFFHSFEPGLATFGLDGLVSQAGLAFFGPDFIGKTQDEGHRRALLLQVLQEHRIVLILDNFETVRSMPDHTGATPSLDDAAAGELRQFLQQAHKSGNSLILITSRSEEAWLGDINRLSIGGLDVTEVHELADDLLANKPRAQKHRESKAFGDLLTMLHGHPLSLRLLLPLLELQEPETLIAGLEGQQPLPANERRDPGRLDSLDASVAYSIQQLDTQDQTKFAALSLFEGVVNTDLLATLSKADQAPARFTGVSVDEWKALLDRATDLGLLSGLGMGCYRLHPALPGYLLRAWKKQAGETFAGEREATQLALIQATAAFGSWLFHQIRSGSAELAMTLIDLQRRSLGRVLGEALERSLYDPAQDIMQPLNYYWDARGQVIEANGWADRIRLVIEDEAGKVTDFESEAGKLWIFVVVSHANRLHRAGRLDEAEALHAENARRLETSETANAKMYLANSYHQTGMVAQERGDQNAAEEWYKKSLAINEELGNRPGMASAYHQIGIVAQKRGNHVAEEEWYKKSLAIREELGNKPGIANAYHQFGTVALLRGDHDAAEEWYKKSLAIREELGNKPDMGSSYHQIGMVAQLRSDHDAAEDWYKKSLAINEELGNRPGMAMTYGQLGLLAKEQKDVERALDWMVRCNALFSEFPHPSTGPGPHNLARLTEAFGIPALEASWQRCTGATLPDHVRAWVETEMAKSA